LEEFPVELRHFAAFIETTMLRAQPALRLGMAERLPALSIFRASRVGTQRQSAGPESRSSHKREYSVTTRAQAALGSPSNKITLCAYLDRVGVLDESLPPDLD
jgi:hypothetical protein